MTSNYALYTICNDSFKEGVITMIYSFLRNNLWFDGDIVILCDTKYCILSEKSRNHISKLYPKISFKEINFEDYDSLFAHWKNHKLPYITPSMYTFEIFLTQYDKVLYLDADIVVLKDMRSLFENDSISIGACRHDSENQDLVLKQDNNPLNFGVVFVNTNNIPENLRNNLIETGENFDFSDPQFTLSFDLDIFNKCISDLNISAWYIPSSYNSLLPKYSYATELDDPVAIHYIYIKPWNRMFDEYKLINKIWSMWHARAIRFTSDPIPCADIIDSSIK